MKKAWVISAAVTCGLMLLLAFTVASDSSVFSTIFIIMGIGFGAFILWFGYMDKANDKKDNEINSIIVAHGGIKYAVITDKQLENSGSIMVWFKLYFNDGATATANCVQGTSLYVFLIRYCA